jgi:hypothetical protein
MSLADQPVPTKIKDFSEKLCFFERKAESF